MMSLSAKNGSFPVMAFERMPSSLERHASGTASSLGRLHLFPAEFGT